MNIKQTDKEKISKLKCQSKGCPNKSSGIFKTKPLCEGCYSRANPVASDRKFKYINYAYPRRL